MSTEGFAQVISILSNSLSGVGKLVSKGVTWCGQKMVESYHAFASDYQREYQVELPSPAKLAERQRVMVRMIEQLSEAGADTPAHSTGHSDEELAQMFHKALAALNSMDQNKKALDEQEYEHARHLLRAEINKCQGFVPAEDIIAAKQALDGSLATVQAAYQTLQQAWLTTWDSTDDTQALWALQIQQTNDTMDLVRLEMATIRKLFSSGDTRYESRLLGIEKTLQIARQRIGPNASLHDPQKALEDAQKALKELQALKQSVAHTLSEEWDKRARELAEARGRLKALESMVQEAVDTQVVAPGKGQAFLEEQLLPCRQELVRIEAHPDRESVAALLDSIEQAAQHTFRLLGEGQQTRTADLIASTLGELGFVSNAETNTLPAIDKVGASVRVLGTQNGKLTIFYIDRDGEVSYDFSGYKGLECTLMASRIFSALRQKGLIIVDTEGAQKINQRPLSALTPNLLQGDEFAPKFDENKLQAQIHARILRVLQDKMGFTQILQNSSGGSIVIDAFHGHIGYHVVLTGEGKHTITRHADDGWQDTEDQLALALAIPAAPPSLPAPASFPQAAAELPPETGAWEQPARRTVESEPGEA